MLRFATAVCMTTFLAGLPAQQFIDTFPNNSSGPPPGWTVQAGKWSIYNGHLVTDGDASWGFITKDGYNPVNCVIDFEAVYYDAGLQFAGAAVRFTNPTTVIVGKVQENSVVTKDFDRMFISERGGTAKSTYKDLKKPVVSSCILRTIVLDDTVTLQCDLDKNGVFDQTIEKQLTKIKGGGLIGASTFGYSEIDNYEFHDAVLVPAKDANPKVGTTYKMELATTSANKPWLAILSTGNTTGIALGERALPVDLDELVYLSLEFSGVLGLSGLTDTNGRAKPGLVIPNWPELIGANVFACAFTVDPTKPFGVDNISNELAIEFVK